MNRLSRLLLLTLTLCAVAWGADFDTATVERLHVEVRHEMYTVVDTVLSTVHFESGKQVYVRLADGRGIKYDRVEILNTKEAVR